MGAERKIGCAVIGYGAMHNFGQMHARWIENDPELQLHAICDRDRGRLQAAKQAFPQASVHEDVREIWNNPEIELVTLVTPNYTHRELATEAFAHGKHVLTENAMCLTADDATLMIDAARKAGKMLAVHHNRRHDGNYRLIKQIVDSGRIGEVFHVEFADAHYGHPFPGQQGHWWTDKERSGGAYYFYGPQAIDWILDLVPSEIETVSGLYGKRIWHDMTNEDEVRALIRFSNGATADFLQSYIDASGRPMWRIIGTKGAIVDSGKDATKGYQIEVSHPSSGSLKVVTMTEEGSQEEDVPYLDSDWHMFYRDVADHLLRGKPVPISGEVGRRVIGVLETARKSCTSGLPEAVTYR